MIRLSTLLVCSFVALAANAHERSESTSRWVVDDGGLAGQITLPSREITRLSSSDWSDSTLATIAADEARRSIAASDADGVCADADVTPLPSAAGFVRLAVRIDCGKRPGTLEYRLLLDAAPGHNHLLSVAATPPIERVLTTGRYRVELDRTPPSGGLSEFLRLGVSHIASGIDHLLFLVALLLVVRSTAQLVGVVTGFTVGHSATLGLTVSGLIEPNAIAVESAIAFTIAVVALEPVARAAPLRYAGGAAAVPLILAAIALATGTIDTRSAMTLAGLALFGASYLALAPDSASARFVVAALFGLIHGLGFAGFLLAAGIDADNAWRALIGFNLGVEVGQLLFVAGLLIVARVATRTLTAANVDRARLVVGGTCAGAAIGWLIARTLAV